MVRCLPGGKWNACLTLCACSPCSCGNCTPVLVLPYTCLSQSRRGLDMLIAAKQILPKSFKASNWFWNLWTSGSREEKRQLQFHLLYVTRYQRKSGLKWSQFYSMWATNEIANSFVPLKRFGRLFRACLVCNRELPNHVTVLAPALPLLGKHFSYILIE